MSSTESSDNQLGFEPTALLQSNVALERQLYQLQQDLQQTKSALQDREHWLHLALNAENMAVWDYNLSANQTTVSERFYSLFGVTPEQFAAHQISADKWQHADEYLFNYIHPDDIEAFSQADQEAWRTGTLRHKFRIRHPDRTIHWMLSSGEVFYNEFHQPIRMSGVTFDVTKSVQLEEQLRISLAEKEVLLREIHHRVKNNLQIISSLLNLQVSTLTNESLVAPFRDLQSRVQAIALLHEKLYQLRNLAHIPFAVYVQDLMTNLLESYCLRNDSICWIIDIPEDVELDANTVMICGLIINELVTNALKYAFPDQHLGEIGVGFASLNPQQHVLTIWDNGVGIPDEIECDMSKSLGIRLVNALARQIRGTLELEQSQGRRYRLVFPKDVPSLSSDPPNGTLLS